MEEEGGSQKDGDPHRHNELVRDDTTTERDTKTGGEGENFLLAK